MFTHEQNVICIKTHLDGTTREQTIISRQFFADHVVGTRPMKKKKKFIKWQLSLSHIDIPIFSQKIGVLNESNTTLKERIDLLQKEKVRGVVCMEILERPS